MSNFMFDLDPSGDPLFHLARYVQDTVQGFPILGGTANLSKDFLPQLVSASEPIRYGQLLNIYEDSNRLLARLATSDEPLRYCNSIALSSSDSAIFCAIRVARIAGISHPRGPLFLGQSPGESTDSINLSTQISQCVGYSDGKGSMMFYYHTPYFVGDL